MSASTPTTSCMHSAAQHAAHYEALREHVMVQRCAVGRHGLALLLRQGLAVCMNAWSTVLSTTARSPTADTPRQSPVPDEVNTQLLGVLVAMTLGHIQQVHP